jgi:hypothetical protein
MTGPIGISVSTPLNAASGSAAAGSDGPAGAAGLFAALVGGVRSGQAGGGPGPDAAGPSGEPKTSGGSPDGARSELVAGIVALALQAQDAFAKADGPQAQAEILLRFGQALGRQIGAFDGAGGGGALALLRDGLMGQGGLAQVPTMQPEPVAVARAALALLGLDAGAQPVPAGQAHGTAVAPAAAQPAAGSIVRPGQSDAAAAPRVQQVRSDPARSADSNLAGPPAMDGEGPQEVATAAGPQKQSAGGVRLDVAPTKGPADMTAMMRVVLEAGEAAASQTGRAAAGAGELAALHARPAAEGQVAPAFARHLSAQVSSARVSEGVTRIELTPRGLGDIEIDMRHDEAGKLRIVLKAENPAVLNAFRQDREILLGALRDGGFAAEEADLSFESFSGHQSNQQSDHDAWRSAIAAGGVAVAEPASASSVLVAQPSPPSAGRSGLDIIT